MASELSSIEALPRIWAIEVLARSKQLNTSELIDLVRKTPELSDDIGKNARELVSFRILETLFAQGSQSNNADASGLSQKIEFDPSNSCEDVLRHILQKMSTSNLKCGASEILKRDIQSFFAHKRDHLPMFALLKLKDAILESSHSVFASLRERSGLVGSAQCNDNIPGDGDNSNPAPGPEERSKDIQVVLPNQDTGRSTSENGVDDLPERPPDRNSLSSKRNRTDSTGGKLERETHNGQIMQEDCCDPYAEPAKKFKQDVHITEHAAVKKLILSAKDGQLANSSEGIVEHIDKEGCNLENEAETGGMDTQDSGTHDTGNQHTAKKFKQDVNITEHAIVMKPITSTGDGLLANSSERNVGRIDREGCYLEKEAATGVPDLKRTDFANFGGDQFAALKLLARSTDIVAAGDWNCQLQTPLCDNIEVNMPGKGQGQSNCVDKASGHMKCFEEKASIGTSLGFIGEHNNVNEAINSFHHNLQKNTSTRPEANDKIVHNQVLETASDSDEYHDERNNIASKKNAFLSSQCTYSEDSLETQQNLCMKCNSGGQLLICSSNTCPLVVHESCLGSAAMFDGDGKFYCPFCAYSRAISEYLEVKTKASLARKDLATFIGLKVGNQPKLSTRSHSSKQNQATGIDEMCENNEASIDGDSLNEADHTHKRPSVGDGLQAGPSMSCVGNSISCGEKVADLTDGALKTLEKENLEGEGREQECQSPIRPEEQQIEVQALHKSDADIPSHEQADINHGNERRTVIRGRKKVKHPPESSLPSELPNQKSCESSEDDDEKSSGSKYSMRSGRQDKQYIYPAIPQFRRKRRPWTKVEEEKLKEGVERFASDHELSIPWKTILEFGADVFEKGRTTVDLKDKWRNICKAGPKSK